MIRPLTLAIVASVALVACAPSSTKPVVSADKIVISLSAETTDKGNGIMHTTETMHLAGAVDMDVIVRELEADGVNTLQQVDDSKLPDGVLAFFTAYYAGGGDDVRVRKASGGFIIEHRFVDEMAETCPAWEAMQIVTVDGSLPVEVEYDGQVVDSISSTCPF